MTRRRVTIAAVLGILTMACGARERGSAQVSSARTAAEAQSDSMPTVVLATTMGRIVLELDRRRAPRSVENFLRHVELGFYDGLTFHRVIRGFMIQAGLLQSDMRGRTSSAPPVPNEADNGLRNVRGAVALARTSDPQSGGTQFFINTVDNPRLDFRSRTPEGWGYAVFGRVKEGMDVADRISRVRTTRRGAFEDVPVEPVTIMEAYVARDTSAVPPR